LGNAHALLFPIDWPEPFGLVMIEAMACGTPVIAFKRGSVPEVIENGVSGFVVEDELSAVAAVKRLNTLPRERVRAAFDARFTSKVMAQNYVKGYEELLRRKRRTVLREVNAG
ncbi:glycosyl transferase group 1 protein, partial [Burkholderia pseudomallei 354a]